MCECLEHEDGGMYLCPVCADKHRYDAAEIARLRALLRAVVDADLCPDCGRPPDYPVQCRWCDLAHECLVAAEDLEPEGVDDGA